jgi:hypothetical protein
MFDLITVLTAARSLRRACEARVADRDDAGAEHTARVALLDLARGLDIEVYPTRPSDWRGTDTMARTVEADAEALAEAAVGSFHPAGHIARLSLHFSALATRLGCEVMDDTDDRAAMAAVEGEGVRDAAE